MTDRGFAIAIAAAGLFAAACQARETPSSGASPAPAAGSSNGSAKVVLIECHGINDCRGKSACMTPANECSGQNSCKGRGWLAMTETECKAKGGAPKPMAGM